MKRFQDQTFVITGGTSGIGLAAARRLAAEGAGLAITGTNADRLSAVAAEFPSALVLKNDAADPEAAEALGQQVSARFGTINGAFLNAGFGRFQPLEMVTADEFDAQYHVNVRGPLLHARVLSPLIQDGGAVLLNTSVAREMGMPGAAIYASTKGALRTLTRVLARELAPRGIRVNAVSPGPIESAFFARTGMSQEQIQGFAEQILATVPLGRFGAADEIASAAAFLLSADASFITGAELAVDGGMAQL